MIDKKPEEVIRLAVKGMLPKNKLSNQIIKKLKIYAGSDHPHDSQQPEIWKLIKWAKSIMQRAEERLPLQESIWVKEKEILLLIANL